MTSHEALTIGAPLNPHSCPRPMGRADAGSSGALTRAVSRSAVGWRTDVRRMKRDGMARMTWQAQ